MKKYTRYWLTKDISISFDSKGYITEVKGFNFLMWYSNDTDLIGKHIDELSEILEKNCLSRNIYLEFEAYVHVKVLKEMLQNANNIINT